jgi:outer membrane receptor protein involved in Fe transport
VIGVVVGVVVPDRITGTSTASSIERADTTVEESSVIRARAQDLNVSLAGSVPSIIEGLIEATKVGINDLLENLSSKGMQLRGSTEVRSRTTDSDINVQIRDSCVGEPVDVLLNPFSRANDTPFFSIPRCENNVSLGLPA